ncbi:MAG: Nre family DNA repair protein [Candidatus Aenigmarchaeota archaeon]|nr:Nre family DNA repair protein [Candidatus Aenigmarchaeota archaeon]
MRIPVCVICKGGKLLCGKKVCPILERVKFWKKTIENVKDFVGTSPPSLFVGRAFYPRVFVGILSPPQQMESAGLLDFPEKWFEQKSTIDQILNYRGQLVYSRFKSDVKNPKGKLMEVTQELSMSKKPTDVEIQLKKKPRFTFSFDPWVTPIGNPAPVVKAELTENPSVERRVEYLVSDHDIKAQDAVLELYKHKLPVSRIQKIFSAGLLGVTIQRKLCPTRWSITATDSIISRSSIDKIKNYPELNEIRLFSNTYLGNHFEILLIPGPWRFEVIEAKFPGSVWNLTGRRVAIYSDWENYWGRKTYADRVGGAYYSARLACSEYLRSIKRQASVLVLREVYEEYYAPMGVFVIRETCREAFKKSHETFSDLSQALNVVSNRMKLRKEFWYKNSKLLEEFRVQKSLKYYWT